MSKEMLINVSEGEECRIALVEDGRLEELYIERTSATSHVGNIYKGKVTNVEASIQAAFIDFGLGRNGFLHVSDLLPEYFGKKGEDVEEFVGKKMARRDRPPIQRCLRRGDEIIVQVIKEGIGTKGPTLSSYLSVSGKMLVMMPGVAGRGVSRKIEDEQERRRLKQILVSLRPPEDCGFIIRTEATGKGKPEIERDLKYLSRLWDQMKRRRDSSKGPTELYTEGDLVTRTIRDVFNADVDRLIVDSEEVADRVREVIRLTSPRAHDKVEAYTDPIPLFHKYGIERDVELMYSRHVPLPSGGSLVIDSTEAVVAIDVNSGKFREHADAETTAFKVDMEAADEICRQLKLRDLGGVIICDFIDLRYERNRQELEQRIVDNFKKDKAKTKVLRMSQFGIIEITRQRMRPSLKRSVYGDCPHCKGAGLVKSSESMSLDVMRRLAISLNDEKVVRAELGVCGDVAEYLNNRKRRQLANLEDRTGKEISIRIDPSLGVDAMKLDLFDNRDGLVLLPELSEVLKAHPHTSQLNVRQPGRPGGKPDGGKPDGGKFDDRRRGTDRKPPIDLRRDNQRTSEPQEAEPDRYDLEETDESYDSPAPAGGRNRDEGQRDNRRDTRQGDSRQGGSRQEGRRDEPRRDGGRRDEPQRNEPRRDNREEPRRDRDEPRRDDRSGRPQQGGGRQDNRQREDARNGPVDNRNRRDEPRRDEPRQNEPRRDGQRSDAPRRDDGRREGGRADDRGRRDERGGRDERGRDERGRRDERPQTSSRQDAGRQDGGRPPARPFHDKSADNRSNQPPLTAGQGYEDDDLPFDSDFPETESLVTAEQGEGAPLNEAGETGEPGEGGQRRRRRRRRRRGRGGQGKGEQTAGAPGETPSGENQGDDYADDEGDESDGPQDEFEEAGDQPTDDAFDVGGPEGMSDEEDDRREQESISTLAASNPSSVADSDAPDLDDDADLFEPVSSEPDDDELGPAPTEAGDQSDEVAEVSASSDGEFDDDDDHRDEAASAESDSDREPVEASNESVVTSSAESAAGESEAAPVAETSAEDQSPEVTETSDEPSEEESDAKPKRGSRKRGGKAASAPKGKAAKAPKGGRAAKATAEKPPASKAGAKAPKGAAAKAGKGRSRKQADVEAASSAEQASSEPVAAPSSRRSKRADQHLVSEAEVETETHFAEPPRRPRSYRDLDSIPDDFD